MPAHRRLNRIPESTLTTRRYARVSYACVLRTSQSGGTVDWTINHSTAVGGESIALLRLNQLALTLRQCTGRLRVAARAARFRSDSAVAARLSVHRGTPSGTPLTVGHAAASSRRAPARATRDAPPPTPDRTKTGRVRAPRAGCRWPRTRGGMATRRSHGSALQVSRAAGERGAKNRSEQREETTCARRGAAAAAGRRHTTRPPRHLDHVLPTASGPAGVTRAAGRCPFGPCMM